MAEDSPRFEETPLGRWQAQQRAIRHAIKNPAQREMGKLLGGPAMFPLSISPDTIVRRNRDAVRAVEREKRRALVAHHARKRQASKIQRTPSWADHQAILAFYVEAARRTAETGIQHDVDHVFPLQGRFVSGLHVEANLQVIPALDNVRKGNRYQP